jgi:hypothetical protein
MMGHINNLLVHMVEKHHRSDGVLRLFTLAGISKKENQPEVVYSEEEFQALYNAAKELYGVGDKVAQKAFSDYFMGGFTRDVPGHLQDRRQRPWHV